MLGFLETALSSHLVRSFGGRRAPTRTHAISAKSHAPVPDLSRSESAESADLHFVTPLRVSCVVVLDKSANAPTTACLSNAPCGHGVLASWGSQIALCCVLLLAGGCSSGGGGGLFIVAILVSLALGFVFGFMAGTSIDRPMTQAEVDFLSLERRNAITEDERWRAEQRRIQFLRDEQFRKQDDEKQRRAVERQIRVEAQKIADAMGIPVSEVLGEARKHAMVNITPKGDADASQPR